MKKTNPETLVSTDRGEWMRAVLFAAKLAGWIWYPIPRADGWGIEKHIRVHPAKSAWFRN
jgi:hypothetical protein